MSESNHTRVRDRVGDICTLVQIAFFVVVLYLVYLAPYSVLTGKADRLRDYVAGAIGMLWWALAITQIVPTLF